MESERKTRTIAIIALLFAIIAVSIGYAATSTTLRINGSATMDTAKWRVRFKNLSDPVITGNAGIITVPTLSDTVIETYKVRLTNAGDSVTYTFDVTNESNDMNAIIGTFAKNTPTCIGSGENATDDASMVCSNLVYELKYTDTNEPVKKYDILNAGETKNLTLTIGYSGSTLPTNDVEINNLDIVIIYDQN